MPLSKDQIKSLIRLANNNPSEHEANAAARRVCKELADNKEEQFHRPKTAFGKMNESTLREWTDPRTGDLNIRISQLDLHNSSNRGIIEILKQLKAAIERPRTWNDVQRSTEPAWSSKPPTEAEEAKRNEEKRKTHSQNYGFNSKDFDFDIYEFMRKYGMGTKSAPEPDNSYDKETGPFKKDAWRNPFVDPAQKEKKRQEVRICSRCGLEIKTFRIKENPFICNPCHWAAGEKEVIP